MIHYVLMKQYIIKSLLVCQKLNYLSILIFNKIHFYIARLFDNCQLSGYFYACFICRCTCKVKTDKAKNDLSES